MGRLFESENLLGALIWCILWITMINTPQKGRYRWIVFKKGNEWVAAALEFNIVEVGDDPNVAYLEMQEAARGYIEAAQKFRGFRPQMINPVLNQKPDKEYDRLWDNAQGIYPQWTW